MLKARPSQAEDMNVRRLRRRLLSRFFTKIDRVSNVQRVASQIKIHVCLKICECKNLYVFSPLLILQWMSKTSHAGRAPSTASNAVQTPNSSCRSAAGMRQRNEQRSPFALCASLCATTRRPSTRLERRSNVATHFASGFSCGLRYEEMLECQGSRRGSVQADFPLCNSASKAAKMRSKIFCGFLVYKPLLVVWPNDGRNGEMFATKMLPRITKLAANPTSANCRVRVDKTPSS